MPALADVPQYPLRAGKRDVVVYAIQIPIGASGAVGTVDAPWPSVTVAKTADGKYDVVVPACTRLTVAPGIVSADATPAILGVVITDVAATSGTFKIQTLATIAGGAAEPESGTVINLIVHAETSR